MKSRVTSWMGPGETEITGPEGTSVVPCVTFAHSGGGAGVVFRGEDYNIYIGFANGERLCLSPDTASVLPDVLKKALEVFYPEKEDKDG